MRALPLLLLAACAPAPEAGRTSVVLIVVDTLRADRLGAYGYGEATSPRIDALAHGGVRFSNFFTTCSWTRPAMASLLTGLYPRTTGVYEEEADVLDPSFVTLAERLSAEGYRTFAANANPNISVSYGFSQGFEHYEEATGRRKTMETADAITDAALSTLDGVDLAGRPYYLQLQYVDPHMPYDPPDSYDRGNPYDGEIRFADAEIGRLLDGLHARGLLDDALVIVTSDHGEGLESHPGVFGSSQHGTHLYDSVLHVPFIVSHPGLVEGRVVDGLASAIDVVPTVLDLLGLPDDDTLPGRSLAGPMRGWPDWGAPELVFAETDWRRQDKVAVRTADGKLVRNDDSRRYQESGRYEGRRLGTLEKRLLTEVPVWERFVLPGREDADTRLPSDEDLEEELAEWEAKYPRRPPINRSASDVDTYGDGSVVPVATGSYTPPDAETQERLRALGYVTP